MSLKPFIKWPGGKSNELEIIRKHLPSQIDRYIEPFLGGGSVFLSLNHDKSYVNDYSKELMAVYGVVKNDNADFYSFLDKINSTWKKLDLIISNNSKELEELYKSYSNEIDLSSADTILKYKSRISQFLFKNSMDLKKLMNGNFSFDVENFIKSIEKTMINKIIRMKKIELQRGALSESDVLKNIETAFKSGYYIHFRHLYNEKDSFDLSIGESAAMFYFIREYCYSSMFRYNSEGKFNVPYGGMSYNNKDFGKKIAYLRSVGLRDRLKITDLYALDFEKFLSMVAPKKNDFIFLDPPYDTDFSTYAQNNFDKSDQIRLAEYMKNSEANFMLIIKNTEFIKKIYNVKKLNIIGFNKKYQVSFKNRNDKDVEHLLIKNY